MPTILIALGAVSGVVMVISLAWPLLMHFKLLRHKLHRIGRMRAQPRYRKADAFLDESQRHTLESLQAMMGEQLAVFPRIRLAELLTLAKGDLAHNPKLGQFVQTQTVDFAVCDRSSHQIMLVVELRNAEDQTPATLARRAQLDDVLEMAGIPLLPITHQVPKSTHQLAKSVQESLVSFLDSAHTSKKSIQAA